jgi:ubiquinone/menaquinone biosynthesis C-methylase UbiE
VQIGEWIRSRVVAQFAKPRGLGGRLAGWEMAIRSSNRDRNRWAVSLLEVHPEHRVLEIGFGPGIAIKELSRHATRGVVCGVDHSEVMRRQAARRNARAIREGRVILQTGSANRLPAFGEPFDRILAVNNLGMWPDPDRTLAHLRRLLRSGGRIAIVSQPRCPGANEHTTAAVVRDVRDRLERAGFDCLRTETLMLKPPVACVLGEVP